MRVSTEWYGMPWGLKYPLAGSLIFSYWARKRWAYSPVGAAAVTAAGTAAAGAAAIAGWIPQMASSDAALRVAVATQADRRRVDEDIIRTFLAVGHVPATPRARPGAPPREREGAVTEVHEGTDRRCRFGPQRRGSPGRQRPGRRPLSGGAQPASRVLNDSGGSATTWSRRRSRPWSRPPS